MTDPAEILQLARARGAMIATAESCTGGLIIGRLTDVPGSSDAVDRGFITYSNAAKIQMLGIRPETLDAHGAVSENIAAEMASGAKARSQAGIAVAVTGIAGPGGSEHKPEGRVCFGLATPTGTATETVEFGALGRDKVRARENDIAALEAGLRQAQAGGKITRESFITGTESIGNHVISGFAVSFSATSHAASKFVEMSMLTGDGRVRT